MDNIIIVTQALREKHDSFPNPQLRLYHRDSPQARKLRRQAAFESWLKAKGVPAYPNFHIFYRISGVRQFSASRIQTKINFMPCLKFVGKKKIYKVFEEPFIFYVYVNKVEEKSDGWVVVEATAASYPSQKLIVLTPRGYNIEVEDILPHVAFPSNVQEKRHSDNAEALNTISKGRFRRFQILYHLSDKADKRYGVIDQMWGISGARLQLESPPEFKTFHESVLS